MALSSHCVFRFFPRHVACEFLKKIFNHISAKWIILVSLDTFQQKLACSRRSHTCASPTPPFSEPADSPIGFTQDAQQEQCVWNNSDSDWALESHGVHVSGVVAGCLLVVASVDRPRVPDRSFSHNNLVGTLPTELGNMRDATEL